MTQKIRLRKPDDFHLHLRQDKSLPFFANDSEPYFNRVLVMPNTLPPLSTAAGLIKYHAAIKAAAPALEVLLTFKVMPLLKPSDIVALKNAGAIAGKIYPEGVTTHSEDGISSLQALEPVLDKMQELDLVLCVHAEEPGVFCMDREAAYLKHVEWVLKTFPKLRVVLEHISDARSATFVKEGPDQLAATITVHHLMMTLDDVVGGFLIPHHFCKPIPKRPEDRAMLWSLIQDEHPRVFLGTDSAPHLKGKKECASGCAGVYSAPVAIPLLIQLFEEQNLLSSLQAFSSENGAHFYRLPLCEDYLNFEKRSHIVPEEVHDCVPLFAGKTLDWSLV